MTSVITHFIDRYNDEFLPLLSRVCLIIPYRMNKFMGLIMYGFTRVSQNCQIVTARNERVAMLRHYQATILNRIKILTEFSENAAE
jgi:hypothetical protein